MSFRSLFFDFPPMWEFPENVQAPSFRLRMPPEALLGCSPRCILLVLLFLKSRTVMLQSIKIVPLEAPSEFSIFSLLRSTPARPCSRRQVMFRVVDFGSRRFPPYRTPVCREWGFFTSAIDPEFLPQSRALMARMPGNENLFSRRLFYSHFFLL